MPNTAYPESANDPNAAVASRTLSLRAFGKTDRGLVRPKNEDQFLVAELTRTLWVRQSSLPEEPVHFSRSRGHLLLVADGMGGHQGGEVASALAVASIEAFVLDLLRRIFRLQPTDEHAVLRDFQQALRLADARIFEEAAGAPELAGMGTTLTLGFVSGVTLFVFHAGDSRCYLFQRGRLEQLTADHTIAAELARRGVIEPAAVRRHPYRNVVTNALGGHHEGVDAEVHRIDLEPGDGILLCTDGLSDMLPDEHLAKVLAAESDPRPACEQLIAAAIEAGGKDNITAIVARVDSE